MIDLSQDRFGLAMLDGVDTLDAITGTKNADTLDGTTGDNVILGKGGGDLIDGHAGDDSIDGGDGDTLAGNGGADSLTGGLGADSLVGGGGPGTCIFNSVTESTDAASDTIDHLKKHDVIDLSAIDADVNTAGDQAFTRVAAFDGHAGQMTLTVSGANTLLQVDVDGDGAADMAVILTGHTAFGL